MRFVQSRSTQCTPNLSHSGDRWRTSSQRLRWPRYLSRALPPPPPMASASGCELGECCGVFGPSACSFSIRLLPERLKPRQDPVETGIVTIIMIQLCRGARVHDAYTTCAAIGKALVSQFRVGKDDNGVSLTVEHFHRRPGRPGIGVVVEECLTERIVDIRPEVRLVVGPQDGDRVSGHGEGEL